MLIEEHLSNKKKEEVKHSVDHRDEYTNLRMLHARLDIFKPIFFNFEFYFIFLQRIKLIMPFIVIQIRLKKNE